MLAAVPDHRRAAPVGVRGRGEQRLVEEVFPVAGELLLGHDLGRHRAFAPAGARHYHLVADLGGTGAAERERRKIELGERLYQAEARRWVVAEAVPGHHAAVGQMQPDLVGLADDMT